MAKGTRITVDLGDDALFRAIKIAAVQQGKTIRQIVVEALKQWLGRKEVSEGQNFQAMIKAINEYRKSTG